jgi:hypothetical protein
MGIFSTYIYMYTYCTHIHIHYTYTHVPTAKVFLSLVLNKQIWANIYCRYITVCYTKVIQGSS